MKKTIKNVELEVLNKEVAEKFKARYNAALERAEKSAWTLAYTVVNSISSKDFKKAFTGLSSYASYLGISPAYINGCKNAVAVMGLYKSLTDRSDPDVMTELTVGQAMEIAPLLKINNGEEATLFFTDVFAEGITSKEIREYVKGVKEDNGHKDRRGRKEKKLEDKSEAKTESEAEAEADVETEAEVDELMSLKSEICNRVNDCMKADELAETLEYWSKEVRKLI